MNVYIFGAGASAAEGAPATRDFFARAWHLLGGAADARILAVWRFLETVFRVPVAGPESFNLLPSVDDVISLVDWSLHVNQGLGAEYDLPRLYQVRRDLEHLLCATLDAALAERPRREYSPHARFVRALQERAEPYALLSLNYDTLLDDALTDASLTPDFGIGCDDGAPAAAGPFLGKLHGSLNWALCPACGQVLVTRLEGSTCTRCGCDRLHGLIISPTLLKRYDGAHLELVWDRALRCIQRATRIVFVGCSMAPADMAIYHLIRRGLLARQGDGGPIIEVINHHKEGASAAELRLSERTVRDRFTRLFGPGVRFDFSGFTGQA